MISYMVSYDKIMLYLTNQIDYFFSIKPLYIVISPPNSDYHITIYRDQWDDYEEISKKPYYLFHISSNNEDNRCSSYFWVDKKTLRIKYIPSKYFQYNQPNFDFFSSRRSQCTFDDTKFVLTFFQKLLWKI